MQRPRAVDVFQLAPRRVLNVRRQSPRAFPAKDFFGLRTSETDNHQDSISHGDNKSSPRMFLARREGSKSLPTLANTFGVKMPFSCAAHFSF
jgi:hypothetical protein